MQGTKSWYNNQFGTYFQITKFGKISNIDEYIYIDENIQSAGIINQKENKQRIVKLQSVYKVVRNAILQNAKLRQRGSTQYPDNWEADQKNKKHRVTRERNGQKILGRGCEDGIWIKEKSQEIYQVIEKSTDTVRERRLVIYTEWITIVWHCR